MKTLTVAFISCLAFALFVQNGFAQTKPNIIFILADDLGYGDLGCYGQQRFTTPNIDRLAREGMRFTQFYSGTSVCAPSRSALMSGLHTGHTYIRGNKEIRPEGQEPIPDSVYTIAEQLKKAGYTTGAFGKWGLGFVGTQGDPNNQGFDQFYGYNCQRESHRYYPSHLWDNNNRVNLDENGNLQHKVTYAPDLIQEKALTFIDQQRANPFFLMLTYTLPHAELEVPNDSIFARFNGRFPEQPFRGQNYGTGATPMGYTSQEKPHATFASMVTRLDLYVGQVMSRLKSLGLEKNTLVIFTSDNGPHTEGGADPAFFNSSGGLRGVKRDLYEGGIRVPFIARWPGQIAAGAVNAHVGAFWDMFPTLSEVANIKPATSATDGISILPALTGKGTQQKHPFLYWEFLELGGRQAVRKDNWKAVQLNVNNEQKNFELYDLAKDPFEKMNLAASNPAMVQEMTSIMQREHIESALFPLTKVARN